MKARCVLAVATLAVVPLATTRASLAAGKNGTLFLHHFDSGVGGVPGAADFAAGDPNPQIGPPLGPGGQIVSSPARFGNALYRSNGSNIGGRLEFNTAANFNLQQGTIDMWVNSAFLTSGGFRGLWGSEAPLGPGDIRMYVYDTGGGRTLGAYMIDDGGAATHWETEAVIPIGLLTNNEWHHVAWEWNLAAQQSFIYWDGQKIGTGATNGQTIRYNGTFSPTLFHIGENQLGSAPWPGYMDEFRISEVMRYNGASFVPPIAAYVLASQWNVDANGNWSSTSNWVGAVPNGVGQCAQFGSIITAPRVVNVDVPVALSQLSFESGTSYIVAGDSTLTIATAAGSGSVAVTAGSHIVGAPLTLSSATNINVAPAGSTLTVTNLQDSSQTISKLGAGALDVNRARLGQLNIIGGTVRVLSNGTDAGVSRIGSLALSAGASLDLTDNDLVVSSSSTAALAALISTARNGGSWDQPGLTSSAAASASPAVTTLGLLSGQEYLDLGNTTFGGLTVAAGDTLVKYTYYGDTDFNGVVDFDDYVRTDAGFNTAQSGWLNGDFDLSGTIDFDDYVLIDFGFNGQSGTLRAAVQWLSGEDRSGSNAAIPGVAVVRQHFERFGVDYANAFLSAVPEPASALGLLSVLGLGSRPRNPRRRRAISRRSSRTGSPRPAARS